MQSAELKYVILRISMHVDMIYDMNVDMLGKARDTFWNCMIGRTEMIPCSLGTIRFYD